MKMLIIRKSSDPLWIGEVLKCARKEGDETHVCCLFQLEEKDEDLVHYHKDKKGSYTYVFCPRCNNKITFNHRNG